MIASPHKKNSLWIQNLYECTVRRPLNGFSLFLKMPQIGCTISKLYVLLSEFFSGFSFFFLRNEQQNTVTPIWCRISTWAGSYNFQDFSLNIRENLTSIYSFSFCFCFACLFFFFFFENQTNRIMYLIVI